MSTDLIFSLVSPWLVVGLAVYAALLVILLTRVLVGALLGVPTVAIEIGVGRVLWSSKVHGIPVTLRLIPFPVAVSQCFGDQHGLKRWVFLSAPAHATPSQPLKAGRLSQIATLLSGPLVAIALYLPVLTLGNYLLLKFNTPATTMEVAAVKPNSIAAQIGLEQGDRILALNGIAVKSWQQLELATKEHVKENKVTLTYLRNGTERVGEFAPTQTLVSLFDCDTPAYLRPGAMELRDTILFLSQLGIRSTFEPRTLPLKDSYAFAKASLAAVVNEIGLSSVASAYAASDPPEVVPVSQGSTVAQEGAKHSEKSYRDRTLFAAHPPVEPRYGLPGCGFLYTSLMNGILLNFLIYFSGMLLIFGVAVLLLPLPVFEGYAALRVLLMRYEREHPGANTPSV